MRNRGGVAVTSLCAVLFVAIVTLAPSASAGHQWGARHWFRTDGQATVTLWDSTTAYWRNNVTPLVRADWDESGRLDIRRVEVGNDVETRALCPMPNKYGKVRVCNYPYDNPYWIGRAVVRRNRDTGHIYYGKAEMDNAGSDNPTDAVKRHTTCQEVGHTLGLGHRDAFTCMDQGDLNDTRPDDHDYEMLGNITHLHDPRDPFLSSDPDWLSTGTDPGTDPCIDSVGVDLCVSEESHAHGDMVTDIIYISDISRTLRQISRTRLF